MSLLTNKRAFALNVEDVDPVLKKLNFPGKPLVDTEIKVSADFIDPGKLDTHTAVWDWGTVQLPLKGICNGNEWVRFSYGTT